MVQVYREPLCRRHYASIFGEAFFFRVIAYLGIIALALVLGFATGGFWQKLVPDNVQATVQYDNACLLFFEGLEPGQTMVWSTSEAINMQFANAYTPASVEVASQDLNNDGKADVIAFRAQVAGNFPIHSVKALLQFQYSLTGHLQLDMYGLAYVEHSSPIQGNALYTDGELLLVQKNQIQDKKYNGLYNVPLLNSSRPTVLTAVQPSMELELQSIIKSYNERNYTTMLTNNYPVWTGGSRNAFELLMMIRIPPNQVVWYRPLAIQMIKFGWIQWLAGYVVLWWILQWVEWFLFSYRLLETRVVSDFQPKKLRF